MRLILRIALCGALAICVGEAQRRAGGSGGGGFRGGGGVYPGGGTGGGGFRGGGGVHRGGGIYRGGSIGGYRGGYYSPGLYSGFGLGYSYSPWYSDYSYGYYPAYSYPVYQPPSNVTVVYQPAAPATIYVDGAGPRVGQRDEYGQEVNRPKSGPETVSETDSILYLIAFRDRSIFAAVAYWTEGDTLHYVTQEHELKQAPLATVDRSLTGKLNGERGVAFPLPAAQ